MGYRTSGRNERINFKSFDPKFSWIVESIAIIMYGLNFEASHTVIIISDYIIYSIYNYYINCAACFYYVCSASGKCWFLPLDSRRRATEEF